MSMLDSFFNKGFKGAKCKTLLKLTIPRIKLLRNRREIQIKQMRKDIAKLLETGQEATARIRVEHIIREENMMAAQEVIELFCELIAVRVPIIETQRECPLDLKEAISSVCFAAPRCADLPELQQVQMLFVSKYGKEFVSAATELMPDCGVNRQLIELLSIRAPPAEVKLKLLKEIAEEHDLDWDPAATETEFFKPHEDLLNGPTQFVSGSTLALPKEKHDQSLYSARVESSFEESDSDSGLDSLDLPEVPKVSLRQNTGSGSAPVIVPPPAPVLSGLEHKPTKLSEGSDDISPESYSEPDAVMQERFGVSSSGLADISVSNREDKQFLPFTTPPPLSSASFSLGQTEAAPILSTIKTELNVDLQDVLAAAQAAADSAERAATAARSAARLAEVRITELLKKRNDGALENNDHASHSWNSTESDTAQTPIQSGTAQRPQFDHHQSFGDSDINSYSYDPLPDYGSKRESDPLNPSPTQEEYVSAHPDDQVPKYNSPQHQPQRLTSMEDDPYFSYPNLFNSQAANLGSGNHSSSDNSRSTHEP